MEMHQDLIFSQVEDKLRPISHSAKSRRQYSVSVSIREKTEVLAVAASSFRANDKFSDNRHVLIDVSTLLTQTTSGFH